MSRRAKAYIILTATLGVIVLQHSPGAIRPSNATRFLCYLVGAAITSQLKVRLPGIQGTLSVNFFFLMMGILDLDIRQVLMLACAGTLGQMLWHARPWPRPVQMVFNLASITVASYCAFNTYHWHVLQALDGSPPFRSWLPPSCSFCSTRWPFPECSRSPKARGCGASGGKISCGRLRSTWRSPL